MVNAKREVDWKEIIQTVRQTLPTCAPWLDQLANHCNTQAPELLIELDTFSKFFMSRGGGRYLGTDFWLKLNSLKLPPPTSTPTCS